MRVLRSSLCAPRISRGKIFHTSAPVHSPVVFPCILDVVVNGMIVEITKTGIMKTIGAVIVEITKASIMKSAVIVEIIDDWMGNWMGNRARHSVISTRKVIATSDL